MNRGRPRKIDDEVIAALLRFGVKPGVVAIAFGVHPKTVERAKRRFDGEVQPTIVRLRAALEQIRDLASCNAQVLAEEAQRIARDALHGETT